VTAEAAARREVADEARAALIAVAGVVLEALPAGALWWADERLLVVADLHLEKGSALARRGQLVPPYDTTETLARLGRLIGRYSPRAVISLGDGFHDGGGAAGLSRPDREHLAFLQAGRDWIWIAGNHDPRPQPIAGDHLPALGVGPLFFRHEPAKGPARGELAGHLHPSARVAGQGRSVRRRCFAADGHRMILPAFGAYAGGLNVLGRAFAGLFAADTFRAFMLGDARIYAVAGHRLRGDKAV
jgi:DNA ligase-associated metallophosphoesterase